MAFFNLTELGADDTVKFSVDENLLKSCVSGNNGQLKPDNSQADGSHVKYTTMLQKHQRSPKGPNDIYNKPVATNMKYGWWMKDGVQNEAWTKNERHANVQSEMTRFVNEMALTNREFTLF